MQNDFCPGGALAVAKGDEVVPVLNKYIRYFARRRLPIFFSRDWHPRNSRHFNKWPAHCLQNSYGARFHRNLVIPRGTVVLSKGMHPLKDSYSAFQALDNKENYFSALLKKFSVGELYVGGLATDYCVKFSVCDALTRGLNVKLLRDAVRAVNIKAGDGKAAISLMTRKGARPLYVSRLA